MAPVRAAVNEIRAKSPTDLEPLHAVMAEATQEVSRNDKISRRLFEASVICYGIALVFFTVLGVHQLLY